MTAVPALAIGRAIVQAIYAGEVGTGNPIVRITKYIRKFELVESGSSSGRTGPDGPIPLHHRLVYAAHRPLPGIGRGRGV